MKSRLVCTRAESEELVCTRAESEELMCMWDESEEPMCTRAESELVCMRAETGERRQLQSEATGERRFRQIVLVIGYRLC